MYQIINDTNITLTRGDTLDCEVTITYGDNEYTPASGDVIRFYLKHNQMKIGRKEYSDEEPLITKIINNSTRILHLNPEDTKELDFGLYVYDIELTYANGDVDTFINNATFKIAPEVG